MTYKEYLQENGKSEDSIRTYLNELNQFKAFLCLDMSEEILLSRHDIESYMNHLKTKVAKGGNRLSPRTLNKKISAIVSYNAYLIEENQLQDLLIKKKDYLKVQENIYSPYKIETFKVYELIDSIKLDKHERLAMIVTLMAFSGLRISEALQLKKMDISFTNKTITVIGKGGKYRIVMMTKFVYQELKIYLNKNILTDDNYMFSSRQSDKVSKSTINRELKKHTTKYHPHMLRHHFAYLLNSETAGLSVFDIAYQLGHSNIKTTQKYSRPSEDRVKTSIYNL